MARTTVADVLADGLARAGAGRIFAALTSDPAAIALREAAVRRGVPVHEAPDATTAGVLAAVSGEIGDGPGAVLADLRDAPALVRGLAHAQRDRAPLIAITGGGSDVALLAPVVKASLVVEPASAGHWIAHAANLASSAPRGPVHLAVDGVVVSESALPVATACRPAPLPSPDPVRARRARCRSCASDAPHPDHRPRVRSGRRQVATRVRRDTAGAGAGDAERPGCPGRTPSARARPAGREPPVAGARGPDPARGCGSERAAAGTARDGDAGRADRPRRVVGGHAGRRRDGRHRAGHRGDGAARARAARGRLGRRRAGPAQARADPGAARHAGRPARHACPRGDAGGNDRHRRCAGAGGLAGGRRHARR